MASPAGPLDGVRVADFTQLAQGPFATQILADLGADVIKIEPPSGDWLRSYALEDTYVGGESVSFLSFNRGKRSIVLDLKDSADREAALAIIAAADIVIENFRPGVMDRLGLGYERLAKGSPALVYCSSSGYGSSGPYVRRPGQDLLIQALTGLPLLNGTEDAPPTPLGVGVADLVAGLHIAYSVLAGLIQARRTGQGSKIEVNLFSSLLALMGQEYTAFLQNGSLPARSNVVPGSPHAGAPYGLYPTSDGHVAIAMNDIAQLCAVLGIDGFETVTSSNLGHEAGELVRQAIKEAVAARSTSEVVSELLDQDLWVAPLQTFDQVVADPQVAHNGLMIEFDHPTAGPVVTVGPPVVFEGYDAAHRPPPLLGEHQQEILAEVGLLPDRRSEVEVEVPE